MFAEAKIKNGAASYEDLCAGKVPFEEVGIKAVDENTLEFTLEAPNPYFLSCLTYWMFRTGCNRRYGTDGRMG